MNLADIKSVYFVGAGGIGMSALVRYFLSIGKFVAGYDRTPSELTEQLIAEGAAIHYEENIDLIPPMCLDKEATLVVLTPAVPNEHAELCYFKENGYTIQKRAQVLGTITHASKGLCVAGTHGKTTTSTMTAHLLHQSHVGCTAFLGGISKTTAPIFCCQKIVLTQSLKRMNSIAPSIGFHPTCRLSPLLTPTISIFTERKRLICKVLRSTLH